MTIPAVSPWATDVVYVTVVPVSVDAAPVTVVADTELTVVLRVVTTVVDGFTT
jgi:hypothetical protein